MDLIQSLIRSIARNFRVELEAFCGLAPMKLGWIGDRH